MFNEKSKINPEYNKTSNRTSQEYEHE